MAQIDVERKKGNSLWVALLVIAIILLVIWAIWEMFDTEEVEAPIAPTAITTPAEQPINAPVIAGQPVAIEAEVLEVPTDRVFIVREGGRTMAVVVKQTPNMEQAVNVNPGQYVRFTGTYYNTADFAQIEGQLEPQAREIVRNQPGIVIVEASQINVVDAAAAGAAPVAQ